MINSTLSRSTPMKRSGRLRPIRKTRPNSDAKLKQRLTKILSLYVRQRDPMCIVCELRPANNAGHLFHRDMPSVEFHTLNVWGVCSDCNYRHETEPRPMRDAVLLRIGEQAYADLSDLAHNSKVKLTRTELEILYDELKSKVKRVA